jgi:hypothetical protein
MENSIQPLLKSNKEKTFYIAALACISAALALGLAFIVPQTIVNSHPTNIKLPAQVTAANCMAVARSAKLLHTPLTPKSLGIYYTAWAAFLAAGHPMTRSTLFDAGMAVSVCLKAK